MKQLWSVVLAVLLTLVYADAEAARLGGGRSAGRQSANVTQREAVRAPAQAPNAAQNTANAGKQANAAGAASAAPRKPWAGMLGGLAAGLGLAWLASSLGLGAEFGNFLLIALLAMVGIALVRMLMRSRQSGAAAAPFAFQGAGATPAADRMPGQYNPAKVGNDASARPWEDKRMAFDATPAAVGGASIGSALAGAQGWGIPEGFDVQGFLDAAKRNFTTLQSAWDRSDFDTLRSMMTDGMLEEVRGQLKEREQQRGAAPANQTEVLMLEAKLLGIEELDGEYMASVEFSGVIREDVSAGPNPFREVWNMTKPRDGKSGWLVAGLQALQ